MSEVPSPDEWAALPPTTESLEKILKRLRAPGGCPWDREQTLSTLSGSLAGETAELLDAVDEKNPAGMAEELGDVLMNVVFMAVAAEEQGLFSFRDVVSGINEKMIRRHRHVFGDARCENAEEVKQLWDRIKSGEASHRDRRSVLDGIPASLSGLATAEKIQKKVSKYGFDWPDAAGVAAKVAEEAEEVRAAMASGDDSACDEELGDLLFAVVNLIRFRKGASAEEIMRAANRKFTRRFKAVEELLEREHIDLAEAGPAKLEELWLEVKKHE